jgi:hypothetical protein
MVTGVPALEGEGGAAEALIDVQAVTVSVYATVVKAS